MAESGYQMCQPGPFVYVSRLKDFFFFALKTFKQKFRTHIFLRWILNLGLENKLFLKLILFVELTN
jgi:hypothetical protein